MPDSIHIRDEFKEGSASRIIIEPVAPEPFAENGIQCGFDVWGVIIPQPQAPLPPKANHETPCPD